MNGNWIPLSKASKKELDVINQNIHGGMIITVSMHKHGDNSGFIELRNHDGSMYYKWFLWDICYFVINNLDVNGIMGVYKLEYAMNDDRYLFLDKRKRNIIAFKDGFVQMNGSASRYTDSFYEDGDFNLISASVDTDSSLL